MRRIIITLFVAMTAMMSTLAQIENSNTHITIKRTNGDSIQYDMSDRIHLKIGDNGKPVWTFKAVSTAGRDVVLSDVDTINLHTAEYDAKATRKALEEFYTKMDGEHWWYNDNWCSDKPISEWYGVEDAGTDGPWVSALRLGYANVKGQIPDCLLRMGPLFEIVLMGHLEGSLPEWLGDIYSLEAITIGNGSEFGSGGGLSGEIPEKVWRLPRLQTFSLENNLYTGPLPEEMILYMMEHIKDASMFCIDGNDYSGKVPESIKNHPKFRDFWPSFLIQGGHLDISDIWGKIPAPEFSVKDMNGNTVNMKDVYSSHKYTIIYKGGWWCGWSRWLNRTLIPLYNAYKNIDPTLLEIVEFNHIDDYPEVEGSLDEYVAENNIPWITVRSKDHRDIYGNLLNYGFTPTVHLVDQQGNIVWTSIMNEKGMTPGTEEGAYYFNILPYLEKNLGKVEYAYESTNFSQDGKVVTLQKATKGQGIDLFFMGDGFVDTDMGDGGKYDQKMREAVEKYFSIEPVKSLRDRFNVYYVKVVSKNNLYGDGFEHTFDATGDGFDANFHKALFYADCSERIMNRPYHVNVIYNTDVAVGRSVTYQIDGGGYVAFMMDGVQETLIHEAVGHGLGNLLDEYVEAGNEDLTLPDDKKTEADSFWEAYGRGANIDWRSNPTQVKWAHFINDTHYAGENLGVYEGSWLYGHGAYRPTTTSLMREVGTGMKFNAPSREAIYKYVMKESEGDSWTYDYETFVAFDEAGRTEFVNSLSSSARQKAPKKGVKKQQQYQTAPPVFIKGTWRDALKKK